MHMNIKRNNNDNNFIEWQKLSVKPVFYIVVGK